MKGIMGWVRLHPYNIAKKVEIVVEHYRQYVAPLLGGRAKAMVVVGSRKEAVRWQLAIDRFITTRGYDMRTLVAFSGEVIDPESGPDPFTEHSAALNPFLKGRDIREAFKGAEYQVLLVANKFQTGFDQPLLCGLYVDKRLGGIQAVQTLSRLNRAYPGKDTTFVLDFVNDPQEILDAFKAYHTTAALATTSDPNIVFNLRAKLDAAGHYDQFEVDRVVAVATEADRKTGAQKPQQSALEAAIQPVAERLLKQYAQAQQALRAAQAVGDQAVVEAAKGACDALTLFKSDMGAYVRVYTFLSQIFDYGNTDLEKRAIFYKLLLPLLEFGREREGVDLSKVVMTHHALRYKGIAPMPLAVGEPSPLAPITEAGSGGVQAKEKALLREIVEKLNELFEGDISDQDQVTYVTQVLKGKLVESPTLQQQALNNTEAQMRISPDVTAELVRAIIEALDSHTAMSSQALGSPARQRGILDVLFNQAGLYQELRARAAL